MNKSRIAVLVCAVALSPWVGAQTADDPSVQYDNTVSGSPGQTGVIVGGGYTQDTSGGEQSVGDGWNIDFSADSALVDAVTPEVFDGTSWVPCTNTPVFFSGPESYACSMSGSVITVSLENGALAALSNQNIGEFFRLNVDIAASASPSQIDFVIANHQPATGAGTDMAAGTFGGADQDGTITITAPPGAGFYASTPAPGGNLNFGQAEVGSAATPVDTLNVQNLSPDTDFDITGFSESGGTVLSFPGTPITVPFGGNVDANISCTPDSRGDNGGSFDVQHDSGNGAASPVAYTFDCAGLAPNVQLPADITVNGTVAGADPTGTLTVTNPQDGFTSTANNVTAAAGAGAAEVTVTVGGPENIAPAGNFDFQVSCDSSAEGSFVRTIDFTWDNPDPAGETSGSVDVTCNISDVNPVYESDPAVGTTLSMSSDFGMQSAATGVDVRNGNPNASADDLVVNSATADNAVFTVTLGQTTFAAAGAFDGTDDISVTCTPQGVGTVNGTLSVGTNDPNEPAGGFTYPLECTGTGDAVTSAPADGGTLNLGVAPPDETTSEGFISFTNNGISGNGSADVSCSITNNPDGVFAATTPLSFTIAEGASDSVGFQCTPTEPQQFSGSVSCDVSGAETSTATFTLTCSGQPLIIPTLSQWGLLVMMLSLLLAGGFAARRMMV